MDRKKEVLQAAFQLFAEDGYHLSMSDIAARVGIKTPSLYSHFKSKDEIIFMMAENLIDDLFGYLNNIIQESQNLSCEEILKTLFFESIRYNDISRLMVFKRIAFIGKEDLKKRLINVMREKEEKYIGNLYLVFKKGFDAGEITDNGENGALNLFMAMLQGNFDGVLLYHDILDVQTMFVEKTWECYWNGIRKK